jgi:hypothetical protein
MLDLVRIRKWARYFAILPIAFLTGCGNADVPHDPNPEPPSPTVILDIPSLVGLPKQEIDTLWGAPECPPENACVYGRGREVYFIDGRAANFTLPPTNDLGVYGFELGVPNFENADAGVKRWNTTIGGHPAEVSDFGNYVYVKTEDH